ncbi:MAG: polyprenyl diphosphate synthase [Candidatus Gastranaerophilales bacterium]|nr:polyprenyl diphosphate synthase [Candidatus Gastranaerophilales bacterium]
MLEVQEYTIKELVEKTELKHIAIIMDGNRRWAKTLGLPTAAGHNKGVESLKKIVRLANDFGIKYITVYAFSTENWKRTQEEVSFLMKLLYETLKNELNEMLKEGVKIKIIGDMEPLDDKLKGILNTSMEKSKDNTGVNLQIAINYSSQHEILTAVKNIAQKVENGELKSDEITKETIENNLYTAGIPDPDIMVRTGGEMRISNYLLWQLAYSEIYVTETYWPEFGQESLEDVVREFAKRSRRFGV